MRDILSKFENFYQPLQLICFWCFEKKFLERGIKGKLRGEERGGLRREVGEVLKRNEFGGGEKREREQRRKR